MGAVFKKIILTLVVLILICIVCIYFLLNTPWLLQMTAPGFINQSFKNGKITQFSIGTQKYAYPGTFNFENVKGTLQIDKEKYAFSLKNLNISGMGLLLNFPQELIFDIKNFSIRSEALMADNAQISFVLNMQNQVINNLSGNMALNSLKMDNIELTNISTNISGDNQMIRLVDIRAGIFQGQLEAQIEINYKKDSAYLVELTIAGLNLEDLQKTSPALASNILGKMNGIMSLLGDNRKISALTGSFHVTEGGQIKAALLSPLIPYLPVDTQRKSLEALVKINGDVPLDKAEVQIQRVSDDELSLHFLMTSYKVNLNLDLTFDIRVDGGLSGLMELIGFASN